MQSAVSCSFFLLFVHGWSLLFLARIELDATSKPITSKRNGIAVANHLGWDGFWGESTTKTTYCKREWRD